MDLGKLGMKASVRGCVRVRLGGWRVAARGVMSSFRTITHLIRDQAIFQGFFCILVFRVFCIRETHGMSVNGPESLSNMERYCGRPSYEK
jgi:hypothetical protein